MTAARLILIKSQALLPRPPAPSEPPQEDLGEDLARQLQEYKRFKQMASLLKERDDKGLHSYLRLATAGITPHVQLDGVTLADLAEAMQRVLTGLPDEVSAPDIVRRQFTIDEKIDLIRDVLRQGRVSFGLLLSRASSRIEAIVTFLALLEMMKQGSAVVEQSGLFGEIMIGPGVAAQTTSGPAPAPAPSPSPSDGAAIAMPAPQPE